MNGENVKLLVGDSLDSPDGLAIDYFMESRLFWSDHKTSVIESVKFDGSDRVTVMHVGLDRPLRIDLFENHIYWLAKDLGSVNKVDKFGRGALHKLVDRLDLADDVKVFHSFKIPTNGELLLFDLKYESFSHFTKGN